MWHSKSPSSINMFGVTDWHSYHFVLVLRVIAPATHTYVCATNAESLKYIMRIVENFSLTVDKSHKTSILCDMEHSPHYWSLCGESISHRWLYAHKTSNSELWFFFLCNYPKQTVEQTVGLSVIWDAVIPLWCHCQHVEFSVDNHRWF